MSMLDVKYAEFIVPAFVITGLVFAGMIGFSLNLSRRWKARFEALSRAGADEE